MQFLLPLKNVLPTLLLIKLKGFFFLQESEIISKKNIILTNTYKRANLGNAEQETHACQNSKYKKIVKGIVVYIDILHKKQSWRYLQI